MCRRWPTCAVSVGVYSGSVSIGSVVYERLMYCLEARGILDRIASCVNRKSVTSR
jgi:hypothetical protein